MSPTGELAIFNTSIERNEESCHWKKSLFATYERNQLQRGMEPKSKYILGTEGEAKKPKGEEASAVGCWEEQEATDFALGWQLPILQKHGSATVSVDNNCHSCRCFLEEENSTRLTITRLGLFRASWEPLNVGYKRGRLQLVWPSNLDWTMCALLLFPYFWLSFLP